MNIQINGREVSVSGDDAALAVQSHQFQDWASTIDPRFGVYSIHVQSVDFRNHGEPMQVRFIKFIANVLDPQGKPLPSIVFMRGGSVAILVILECEGEQYTVLARQPRFPSGNFAFPEIIAGTFEGDGTFVGAAVRELEEEMGIVITPEDLIDLTALVYENRFKGVYTSVGASDEFLRLFMLRKEVSREEIEKLKGKCTGLVSENEQITLEVILLRDLPYLVPDAKSLAALMLYWTLEEDRLL